MPAQHAPPLLLILLGPLVLLGVGCERGPDSVSDYRSVASRIAGPWRLVHADHPPFIGQPSCVETIRIEMNSPRTSTALVTFCGSAASELSRRVPVSVADRFNPDPAGRQCRMTWDPAPVGPPRELYVNWSPAVSIQSADEPAFYAEDVLTVQFTGPWLVDEPNAFGAVLHYARDTADATSDSGEAKSETGDYSPK